MPLLSFCAALLTTAIDERLILHYTLRNKNTTKRVKGGESYHDRNLF